jgi:hypothetical protein
MIATPLMHAGHGKCSGSTFNHGRKKWIRSCTHEQTKTAWTKRGKGVTDWVCTMLLGVSLPYHGCHGQQQQFCKQFAYAFKGELTLISTQLGKPPTNTYLDRPSARLLVPFVRCPIAPCAAKSEWHMYMATCCYTSVACNGLLTLVN